MTHHYVFSWRPWGLVYERTCPDEATADARVRELQVKGRTALWLDVLPDRWFY